jgi:hypothetical protein
MTGDDSIRPFLTREILAGTSFRLRNVFVAVTTTAFSFTVSSSDIWEWILKYGSSPVRIRQQSLFSFMVYFFVSLSRMR